MTIGGQEIKAIGSFKLSDFNLEELPHNCGMTYSYNEKYHSYYCEECDIWLFPRYYNDPRPKPSECK